MLSWLFGPPKCPIYERHLFVCRDPKKVVWEIETWGKIHDALDWVVLGTEGPTSVGMTLLDETRKGPVNNKKHKWDDASWTQPAEGIERIDAVVLRFSAPNLTYCEKKSLWSHLYFEVSAPTNTSWSQVIHLVAEEQVAGDPRFQESLTALIAAIDPFVHATRIAPWIEPKSRYKVPQDFIGDGFYSPESVTLDKPDFSTIDGDWDVTWLSP